MCGGSFDNRITVLPANRHCCPEGEIFVEEICGNALGQYLGPVWIAPTPNDYFQGTFTVTNTGASVIEIGANGVATTPVPVGTTVSISVVNPTSFDIGVDAGDSARYCIKLYKRVLA
ncbi:hypothetical protein AA0X95_03700 [Bacillus sp. 1P10SD]|uniref:hypothetical protein n=1 Tax=Bacillus sp. 1P10SD TaxID=3132265 RepID=UPI0039A668AA